MENGEIERAKFKILCQCAGVVCDDDGIEMQFEAATSSNASIVRAERTFTAVGIPFTIICFASSLDWKASQVYFVEPAL